MQVSSNEADTSDGNVSQDISHKVETMVKNILSYFCIGTYKHIPVVYGPTKRRVQHTGKQKARNTVSHFERSIVRLLVVSHSNLMLLVYVYISIETESSLSRIYNDFLLLFIPLKIFQSHEDVTTTSKGLL